MKKQDLDTFANRREKLIESLRADNERLVEELQQLESEIADEKKWAKEERDMACESALRVALGDNNKEKEDEN